MMISELVAKLYDETGVFPTRSKLHYCDRIGIIDEVDRLDNNYRDYSEDDFERLCDAFMLSDLGIRLEEIKDMLDNDVSPESIVVKLKAKQNNIRIMLKKLA